MKRKFQIENNINMISIVRNIAKRDNKPELLSWAEGVYMALAWVLNNSDTSSIGIAKCDLLQELEVMNEMKKTDWND